MRNGLTLELPSRSVIRQCANVANQEWQADYQKGVDNHLKVAYDQQEHSELVEEPCTLYVSTVVLGGIEKSVAIDEPSKEGAINQDKAAD